MPSLIAQRLADRVRKTERASPVTYRRDPVTGSLRDYLAEHLAGGETHYTTRPGIVSLRRRIGELLAACGAPERAEDGVVVTASEGESLFVTLLGLGVGAGDVIVSTDLARHGRLFDLMRIRCVSPGDPDGEHPVATLTGAGDDEPPSPVVGAHIVWLGDTLGSPAHDGTAVPHAAGESILIGDLRAFPGLDHFQVGFVAGPPDRIKRIMTWKQALSICTAAPSQRAAVRQLRAEER